jgi:predicted nucleic acid-binding protein
MLAILDTHALIWYLYDDPRLSKNARDMLEKTASSNDHVACSALTLVEVLYLQEKERIPARDLRSPAGGLGDEELFARRCSGNCGCCYRHAEYTSNGSAGFA